MIKTSAALLALGALVLTSNDAHAWFKVCNQRSEAIWVAYTHFLSRTDELIKDCSRTFGGGCPYSAWESKGWWNIAPNQCATVLGGDIKNRFSYVHVHSVNGATLGGSHSFRVQNPAFRLHQNETALPPVPSLQCLGQSSSHCTPSSYFETFKEYNTGTAKNYTLNIQ